MTLDSGRSGTTAREQPRSADRGNSCDQPACVAALFTVPAGGVPAYALSRTGYILTSTATLPASPSFQFARHAHAFTTGSFRHLLDLGPAALAHAGRRSRGQRSSWLPSPTEPRRWHSEIPPYESSDSRPYLRPDSPVGLKVAMTVSICRMTTGSGYRYLMESVVRGDGAPVGHPRLRATTPSQTRLPAVLWVPDWPDCTAAVARRSGRSYRRHAAKYAADGRRPAHWTAAGQSAEAADPTHREANSARQLTLMRCTTHGCDVEWVHPPRGLPGAQVIPSAERVVLAGSRHNDDATLLGQAPNWQRLALSWAG